MDGCSISSKRCGNLNISYPFGLSDMETGRSCASLDFEVDCLNSTPVLRGPGFAILTMSYEERSLRVVDLYELTQLRDYNSCHVPRWNTSVKLRPPFKISPANLNLVFYNCTKKAAGVARQDGTLVETRCVNKSDGSMMRRAATPASRGVTLPSSRCWARQARRMRGTTSSSSAMASS
jgi:hypothetical protein